MLLFDLQRYHTGFAITVVDQVLENVRRGLETNVYKYNQHRIATMKHLGELYIYRLVGSNVIFDALWSLVTFGHRMCFVILLSLRLYNVQLMEGQYLVRSSRSTCLTISYAFV